MADVVWESAWLVSAGDAAAAGADVASGGGAGSVPGEAEPAVVGLVGGRARGDHRADHLSDHRSAQAYRATPAQAAGGGSRYLTLPPHRAQGSGDGRWRRWWSA